MPPAGGPGPVAPGSAGPGVAYMGGSAPPMARASPTGFVQGPPGGLGVGGGMMGGGAGPGGPTGPVGLSSAQAAAQHHHMQSTGASGFKPPGMFIR